MLLAKYMYHLLQNPHNSTECYTARETSIFLRELCTA